MDWTGLPSLTALRAFEAAARHASFSAAARELNVTHAAVAQHVRALEDRLGLPLLTRDRGRMVLSEDGQHLAAAVSEGFGRVEATLRQMMDRGSDRALRIALTPSFAESWLMPRIGGFWAAHPEIRLELVPSAQLVDLRQPGFDLAIRYGRGGWPGVESEVLVGAGHAVVAAPALLDEAGVRQLSDLQSQHWLLERGRQEERIWAADHGLDLSAARITEFDTNTMVMQALLAGYGVSIMPSAVVAREVAAGALRIVLEERDSPLAYYMLTRPERVSPNLKTFMRWLRRAA